ncbi:MAG TPA: Tim44 domain-containing protein, partial [Deltaproteobacteria bacterium]|nr:Tim44 domain-containing protein [Deltaproteobacteria bacterium]
MRGLIKGKRIAFIGALLTIFFMLQADCFARVGGSRSMGSRGSRSYTSPYQSSPSGTYQSSQPRSTYNQPHNQPYNQPTQRSSGGLFRGMMGGLAGGFLGSLLFRGLGFGGSGGWGGDGGIGLFEILLLAALGFGIYWFIKKRRQRAMEGAYYQGTGAMGSYSPSYQEPSYGGGMIDAPPPPGMGPQGSVRQSDPSFDDQNFKDMAMDVFFKIQGAWTERNPALVRNLLTDEMYNALEKDAEELRREKKLNKLGNIAVRSVDITEDWQEPGVDFITVKFYANLLDYVVDEATGHVVNGSKTQPVKF